MYTFNMFILFTSSHLVLKVKPVLSLYSDSVEAESK